MDLEFKVGLLNTGVIQLGWKTKVQIPMIAANAFHTGNDRYILSNLPSLVNTDKQTTPGSY